MVQGPEEGAPAADEHVMTKEEKLDIASASEDGGFLEVRQRPRAGGRAGGGEWVFGDDVEKVERAERRAAELAGGAAGGQYAMLNAVVIDKAQRAEEKKLRRKEEKEAKEKGGDSNQRDDLEQQLARGHSTAAPAPKTVERKPTLSKFTESQIDEFKSVKSLRRALQERGIPQKEIEQSSGKPDEVKLLRTLAKSKPSVCIEAATSAKSKRSARKDGFGDKKAAEEIDKLLATINLTREAPEDKVDQTQTSSVGAALIAARAALGSAASTARSAAGSLLQAGGSNESETKESKKEKKERFQKEREAREQQEERERQEARSKRLEARRPALDID